MPRELEFKFFLDNKESTISIIDKLDKSKIRYDAYLLEQFYLGSDSRLRSQTLIGTYEVGYFHTCKYDVKNELIEIEHSISKDDYMKLRSIADKILPKTRIEFNINEDRWFIDFIDDGLGRLVVAEVEVNDDINDFDPNRIPAFLHPVIVAKIPLNLNSNYSNKKLLDKSKRSEIIKEIYGE